MSIWHASLLWKLGVTSVIPHTSKVKYSNLCHWFTFWVGHIFGMTETGTGFHNHALVLLIAITVSGLSLDAGSCGGVEGLAYRSVASGTSAACI